MSTACSSCQNPDACQERLSDGRIAGLVIFTLVFTVVAPTLPAISAWVSMRYYRKKMGYDGEIHEDPPLFGCVPTTWATSGIGVMLFMLAAGFNAMFWIALNDTTGVWGGCKGPIGACGTISCIAGTYRVEMYVFMQVTLTLIPLLIVQQVGQILLQSNENVCSLQRWCARVVVTCLILVTLTGMFPAKYETDAFKASSSQSNKVLRQMGYLHSLGVGVGAVVPVIVTFGVAVKRFVQSMGPDDIFWISPFSLGIRSFYFLLIVFGFAIFLSSSTFPDTLDFCGAHKDQNSCSHFLDNMTAQCDFTNLQETDEFFLPIRYTCKWESFTPKPTHQKFLPAAAVAANEGSSCVRHKCDLQGNSLSIASEFVALFLPVTYLASFGIADLKHLFATEAFVPYEREQAKDTSTERV